MADLRRFLLRLLATFRWNQSHNDLAREVSAHLALIEDDYRSQGMDPTSARLAARRAFGGIEQARERQREARSFRWIADARQDLTYGARAFARNPSFRL